MSRDEPDLAHLTYFYPGGYAGSLPRRRPHQAAPRWRRSSLRKLRWLLAVSILGVLSCLGVLAGAVMQWTR